MEGRKETTRKSRGIFRRTPGKEMKISNGLCLLVEPARKGSGYGGNVARKTLAYIFLRFEIARLESKFEISTVPKSTRNSKRKRENFTGPLCFKSFEFRLETLKFLYFFSPSNRISISKFVSDYLSKILKLSTNI